MIAYLVGRVLDREDGALVVFAGFVGYRVATTTQFAAHCKTGDDVALRIHSVTNEFGTRLFGFETPDERHRFVRLLSVDGVGPVTALAIVSADALCTDVAQLRLVKGVGPKTAAKIVEAFA